ncbi:sensor histidine kinase [Algicola sagamiensis]|uniref:sensor histidine kinase n=1 Tax=Algicola sagamiensis TaxID=163869 RepID=UPI00035F1F67|nr:ATP-binding protein [Algicola sagamiensis]
MSIRLKTILGVALIEAILLALLLSFTLNYLKTTNYHGLDQRARSTVNLFASTVKNAVLSFDLATVDSFTQDLLSNQDILYVAVFGEGHTQLSAYGQLPEAFTQDLLEDDSSSVLDSIFDVKANITQSDIEFGSVWIGFDMTVLNQQIEEAKRWSTFIVIGEMLLVALFSYVLGAFLTKRLSLLKNATDQIARGDRDIDLHTDGKDELSAVTQSFMKMVEQIKHSEAMTRKYQLELEDANENLEGKVQRRTAALEKSNKQLIAINTKLQETKDKLVESEKMASIGIMAAGVAHEINNPMGVIDGNLQMCQQYFTTYQQWVTQYQELTHSMPEENRERVVEWEEENEIEFLQEDAIDCIDGTLKCAKRVQDVVQALEHYSVQSQSERTDATVLYLFDLLSTVITQLQPPENIEVHIDESLANIKPLFVIRSEIHTLFHALFKNAIQACERRDDPSEKGRIEVSAKEMDQFLLIQMKDNGPGVQKSAIKQLFDPFYTTLPVGDGMGLGLTYCYDIVRHHRGKIEIKNATTQGVIVQLTLPLANDQQQSQEAS